MTKYQDIIELNGKTYNLRSPNSQATSISGIKKPAKVVSTGNFITPKPQTVIKPIAPKKPAVISRPPKHRESGANSSRHQLQRSSILMRKSVSKPKQPHKVTEIINVYSKSASHIRAGRASQAQQSPFIRKFSSGSKPIQAKLEPISVAPTPQKFPVLNNNISANKIISGPSKADQLVNQTLQNISSAPAIKTKKPKKHKKLKWGSAIASVLVLVGVVTYMNLPNMNIKLASAQAGFSASVPGYKPDGYSLARQISHQAGQVILGFKSNTDDRSYTVKQEVSNWNSQTLLDNIITSRNLAFTTSSDNGLTIYLYDNGKATWVNGGIWYQIDSNGLNSTQLTNIANSL